MKTKKIIRHALIPVLAYLITSTVAFSQPPNAFKYQAVLRDASGNIKASTSVNVRIDILQGSATGTDVYAETFSTQTNAFGLINLAIGNGTLVLGNFSTIDWSTGLYFVKVSVDGTEMGTSQLLSVPYAMYAAKAGNGFSGSYSDLTNKPDFTKWDKDSTDNVTLTGAQTITGNKTFSGTITVNTPVNTTDAANKAYVDALQNQVNTLKTTLIAGGFMTDIDGNVYNTVKIGTQVWMAENLKTTTYSDGTAIPLVTDNTAWSNLTAPGYCWYNNDAATYKNTYGALYNWYTVVATNNLCPTGWHVPTDAEWTTLITYLGGGTVAGGKMKESGTTHWSLPNTSATNSSGFSGLPGGTRESNGTFDAIGQYVNWYSSTQYDATSAYSQGLDYTSATITRYQWTKKIGYSVRCLKN